MFATEPLVERHGRKPAAVIPRSPAARRVSGQFDEFLGRQARRTLRPSTEAFSTSEVVERIMARGDGRSVVNTRARDAFIASLKVTPSFSYQLPASSKVKNAE